MSRIEIRFGDYKFTSTAGEIWLQPYPNIVTAVSPISESLEAASFRMRVRTRAFGLKEVFTSLMEFYSTSGGDHYVINEGEILNTAYAEPLYFYEDGTMRAKFYVTSVTREGREVVLVEGTSAVGILTQMAHRGGVYFGANAGDVIQDIVQGLDCDVAGDVAAVKVYGWLPATSTKRGMSARDNLQQVLFATGAVLTESATGALSVSFPSNAGSKTIPEARTFMTGRNAGVTRTRVSKITLIEHTYFESQNAPEEVVFDNTNGTYVDGDEIFFEKPYISYRGEGITVDPNAKGANWAKITGTGVLYGRPYVHIQREITRDTGVAGGRELSIPEATLVSSLNSANVLNRVENRYKATTTQSIDVQMDTEKAGDFVNYRDAYGDEHAAFVSGADETISGFRRATLTMLNNWVPKDVGNTYNDYFLITSASGGTITIPSAHRGKKALAILFSGAQGGQGGYDGERGGNGRPWAENSVSKGYGGEGGEGGAPGNGGGLGRYLVADIDRLAASYTGAIGAGGAGGAHGGEEGVIGGDTRLGDYTTADGTLLEGAYINMIDGTVYGEQGGRGTAGKRGGAGGNLTVAGKKGEDGAAGENYNTIWRGGSGGLGMRDGSVTASGGGGGGAAYGASGANGGTSTTSVNYGAAGANASAPAKAGFYRGGTGGNGGGGGGGSSYSYNGLMGNYTHPGAGGLGSAGGQGADGFILIYV